MIHGLIFQILLIDIPAIMIITIGTDDMQWSNGKPKNMKKIAVARTISWRVIYNIQRITNL
jgi:hypothetical protein